MTSQSLLSACFSREASAPLVRGSNWQRLIEIGGEQLILPTLTARLRDLNVFSELPPEIADFLSAVEALNSERNQEILTELAFVASLLNRVGIEPVLLKGAAYCVTGVYQNAASRYLWDVDLLIPEALLPTAVAALIQNGFDPEENYRLGHFRHHHPPLQRAGAVHFELHHSLGLGICTSLLPATEVLRDAVPHDFRGTRVRIPSPDHMTAHLIMHSQIQHPYNERIWPPLRAMYDLVLLQGRFQERINWQAIERRFSKAGQRAVLLLHLLQVRDALGVETPFPIRPTGLTYLRWLRRKLLRALPTFRFIDPVYMYSTILLRRIRLVRNALAAPAGWRYIVRELFAPAFYKRLITDIIEGYGR